MGGGLVRVWGLGGGVGWGVCIDGWEGGMCGVGNGCGEVRRCTTPVPALSPPLPPPLPPPLTLPPPTPPHSQSRKRPHSDVPPPVPKKPRPGAPPPDPAPPPRVVVHGQGSAGVRGGGLRHRAQAHRREFGGLLSRQLWASNEW